MHNDFGVSSVELHHAKIPSYLGIARELERYGVSIGATEIPFLLCLRPFAILFQESSWPVES